MITETDPGSFLQQVYLRDFNTLDDLKNLSQASAKLLGPNVAGSGVSIGGLASFSEAPVIAVALPATLPLFLLGLTALVLPGIQKRRPKV